MICSLSLSPDGKSIATGCDDGTVRLWDAADGKELAVLGPFATKAPAVAVSGERALACGHERGEEPAFRYAEGGRVSWTSAELPEARAVALRGGLAAAGGGEQDGRVLCWSQAGRKLWEAHAGSRNIVSTLAFSPDGSALAACRLVGGDGPEGRIELHSSTDGAALWSWEGAAAQAGFSPDGRHLLAMSRNKRTLTILQAATGKALFAKEDCDAAGYAGGRILVGTASLEYPFQIAWRDLGTGAKAPLPASGVLLALRGVLPGMRPTFLEGALDGTVVLAHERLELWPRGAFAPRWQRRGLAPIAPA
ncbi:MAG: hypothetical protein HY553_02435 [Elusimicrobia bacterium]|nr:hypothetical protein [Elusimicrobiota bacterium]